MPKINLAAFADEAQADAAIGELVRAGYDPKEISIMMKDSGYVRKGGIASRAIGEGAVSGVATGGVLGGIAGLLIGVGAIAIPGIGGLLVAGPLAAALGLTGAVATTVSGAVTGALAGGVVGGLVGLGVPKETALAYEERLREGGVLLAVPSRDVDADHAVEILRAHGADQVEAITLRSLSTTV
jgi:hypothetical protein